MSESGRPEHTEEKCDVLIQGAGIGGLTLAIALQQRGFVVRVVERASGLAEVGAGIWMAANPMQVFARLGFAQKINESGWVVKRLRLQDWRSGDIRITDMSDTARQFGFETVALHRCVLQRVLFEQLKADPVRFHSEVQSLHPSVEHVVATLSDGSRCQAAVVAGADGFSSQIRQMAGLVSVKRYSGSSSYRAIARGARILPTQAEHDAYEILGRGCRLGFSKINADDYYWYLTFDAVVGGSSSADEMKAHAEKLVRACFPQWIGLLKHTRSGDILRTDISDLKPLRSWSSGCIGLLGDAAHATTPNLGQGGAMAVEDALALAEAFEKCGLNQKAWSRFEHLRRKKVDWTVSTSRVIGKICHLRHPLLCSLRNVALRNIPERISQKQMERIYSLDKPFDRSR